MPAATVKRPLLSIDAGRRGPCVDDLAAEEPLEIRLGETPLAVTMRTPGDDFDLVAGFLLTEGLVDAPGRIRRMRYCTDGGAQHYNIVTVDLDGAVSLPDGSSRNFFMSSSCGVCGKASIEGVRTRGSFDVGDDPVRLPAELLSSLPGHMREAQRGFDRTGGLHAAGLFDESGELVCLREDVGRHNAFDKAIGRAALDGRLPLRSHVLLASGRASFELTQKALMAGVPVLAAVSAPSSLAVDLAEEAGMTLVGFLRGPTMNVYTRPDRVTV